MLKIIISRQIFWIDLIILLQIQPFVGKKPIILIGNKTDRRDKYSSQPADGDHMRDLVSATAYLECHAKNEESVVTLFRNIISIIENFEWPCMHLKNN